MPYCENCGAQLNPNSKFCGGCGAARTQPAQVNPAVDPQPAAPKRERLSYYSPPSTNAHMPPPPVPIMGTSASYAQPAMQQPYVPQTQPVTQQAQPQPIQQQQQTNGEATVGVIVFRKPKSLGRWDTYTGVVTTQRLIIAEMTSEMLTQAAQQSREQAKADGKGFWGQWADQLRATFGYAQKYMTMPPQAILAESPSNFAIYNSTIGEIKIHLKNAHREHNQRRELEAEIFSTAETYSYHMDENSEFTDLLKRVYGERVKMPFGYFSKSINIKL